MKTIIRILVLFGLTFAVQSQAATLTILGLDSNGLLEGAPGQTVGFGFTFTNNTDYAILDFSTFAPVLSFADYTDFIASDYITTLPTQSYTEQFSQTLDPSTGIITETGIGQVTIHSDATVGASQKGVLTLDYDLYIVDPNSPFFDPSHDGVSFGDQVTAFVGVKVVAPATPTPEPSTFALFGLGCLILGAVRRRASRARSRR